MEAREANRGKEGTPHGLSRNLAPPANTVRRKSKPSFSFRVGEDWSMETDPPEGPDELEITWRSGTVNLFILNIKEVYEPNETASSTEVQAPKDMVAWFQHHPYLKTDKPKPVTVGGVKGVRFHVVVVDDLPKDDSPYCFQGVMPAHLDCADIVPRKYWDSSSLRAGD